MVASDGLYAEEERGGGGGLDNGGCGVCVCVVGGKRVRRGWEEGGRVGRGWKGGKRVG